MTNQQVLLAEIPSSNPLQRLQVLLCVDEGRSHLELHHQSWGEGVGWYTQQRVPLESDQVELLRHVLKGSGAPSRCTAAALAPEHPVEAEPAILRLRHA